MNILIVIVISIPFINTYKLIGPKNDSNNQSIKSFIINGITASEGDVPWQVGLFADFDIDDYHYLPQRRLPRQLPSADDFPFCGGSIIATRAVLTAAHFCVDVVMSDLTVKYDGIDYLSLITKNSVDQIIIHENYTSDIDDFDYCVLILTNDVIESETVDIIKLASEEPNEGDTAIVSGWGDIYYDENGNANIPLTLQLAMVLISNKADCVTEWSNSDYGFEVTDHMLCAESTTSSGCYGDSVGPLVVDNELVGIVAWGGPGCLVGSTALPNVYSDVFMAKNWIKDTISANNAD